MSTSSAIDDYIEILERINGQVGTQAGAISFIDAAATLNPVASANLIVLIDSLAKSLGKKLPGGQTVVPGAIAASALINANQARIDMEQNNGKIKNSTIFALAQDVLAISGAVSGRFGVAGKLGELTCTLLGLAVLLISKSGITDDDGTNMHDEIVRMVMDTATTFQSFKDSFSRGMRDLIYIDHHLNNNAFVEPEHGSLHMLLGWALDASISPDRIQGIIESYSNKDEQGVESFLKAVEKMFGFPGGVSSSSVEYASRVLTALLAVSERQANGDNFSIISMASASGIKGSPAWMYALLELNPMAVIGNVPIYAEQAVRLNVSNYSGDFIKDRLEMLQALIDRNLHDDEVASGRSVVFQDNMTGITVHSGSADPNAVFSSMDRIIFGQDLDYQNENLNGQAGNDRIYGLAGDDFLAGVMGNDHLDGGSGTDQLVGGAGNDLLYGGTGNDMLNGGTDSDKLFGGDGDDTYVFAAGDGSDEIVDTDGKGKIMVGLTVLSGSDKYAHKAGGLYEWKDENGVLYSFAPQSIRSGQYVDLTIHEGLLGGGTITIRDFDLTAAQGEGYLGIKLPLETKLALAETGEPSPFEEFGKEPEELAAEFIEHGGLSYTVFLNRPARAGDTIEIGIASNAAQNYVCSYGTQVVSFGSGPVTLQLKEGQSRIELALINSEGLSADDSVTLTATFRGTDHNDQEITASASGSIEVKNSTPSSAYDHVLMGDFKKKIVDGFYEFDDLGYYVSDGPEPNAQDLLLAYFEPGTFHMDGGGGNDLLAGGIGDDLLIGGDGDDVILGSLGKDQIFGGEGNDFLFGSSDGAPPWGGPAGQADPSGHAPELVPHGPVLAEGFSWLIYDGDPGEGIAYTFLNIWPVPFLDDDGDTIDGGGGNDFIQAGTGDDYVRAGSGSDTITGLRGDDVLYGEDGDDTIQGDSIVAWSPDEGTPDDPRYIANGNDFIDGGAGNDRLFGQGGNDAIFGGDGDDKLIGDGIEVRPAFNGSDYLDGGTGNDYAEGWGGKDVLYGGQGDDVLYGDADVELLSGDRHEGDYLDGEDGNDQLIGGGGSDHLRGGNGNDLVWGDDPDLALDGSLHGEDLLEGDAGDDQLVGGGKNDIIYGGEGNDILLGDDSRDNLSEDFNGQDFLDGGEGDDYLVGGGKDDHLIGGEGNDDLHGDDVESRVGGSFHGNDVLQGGDGNDRLKGGGKDDILEGGDGDDQIHGDDNEESLAGASHGSDKLYGGNGSDLLLGGGNDDFLDGGNGDDQLHGDDLEESLSGSSHGSDTLDGRDGNDVLVGGGRDDTLIGGDGDDSLFGDDDHVNSLSGSFHGNDLLDGGAGDDYLYGGGGDDALRGGEGDDAVYGGAGNDSLFGDEGINFLDGGDGDDVLVGQGSSDVFVGGAGDDLFIVSGSRAYVDGGSGQNTLILDGVFIDIAGGAGHYNVGARIQSSGSGMRTSMVEGESQGSLSWNSMSGPEATLLIELDETTVEIAGGLDAQLSAIGTATGSSVAMEFLLASAARDLGGPIYAEQTRRWFGTDGDDMLEGVEAGLNYIGGGGNDYLLAQGGGNTFFYDAGDGADYIVFSAMPAEGEENVLVFGGGLTADDVTLDLGSLMIRVGSNESDAIHIENFDPQDALSSPVIHRYRFQDGTELTYEQLLARGFDRNGAEYSDYLEGTNLTDRFRGGRGDDWMSGGAGNDQYYYYLGDGYDRIEETDATEGNIDVLTLGEGLNLAELVLDRNDQNLSLQFNDGAITLEGQFAGYGQGIEQIVLAGAEGQQLLLGSDQDDTLSLAEDGGLLLGAFGNDTLTGGAGDDRLYGANPNYVWWQDRDNNGNPVGLSDDDILVAGAGDDTLDGGHMADQDVLDGGSGDDTYLFRRGSGQDRLVESEDVGNHDRVVIEADSYELLFRRTQSDLILLFPDGGDRLTVVDFFVRTDAQVELFEFGNTTLTFDDFRSLLMLGTEWDDVLIGFETNDELDGGLGNDHLDGAAGSDHYYYGRDYGTDTILDSGPGSDIDTLHFAEDIQPADVSVTRYSDDLWLVIKGTRERVIMPGWFGAEGPGIERIEFGDGTVWGAVDLAAMAAILLTATAETDVIVGSMGDDDLVGLAGDDEIHGQAGDDRLAGGSGDDWLAGGAGNDIYRYELGDGNDVLADGGSDDADGLEFGAGVVREQVRVTRDAENLYLVLQESGEALTIAGWYVSEDNRLSSVSFSDGTVLSAADIEFLANTATPHDDYLVGAAGDDVIDALDGHDQVYAGVGNDSVMGGAGDDYLNGEEGDDSLAGGDGDDFLAGGDGNDLLAGGAGNDHLDGGQGDDEYRLDIGEGADRILDAGGEDILRLGAGFETQNVQVFDGGDTLILQDFVTGTRVEIESRVEQTGDGESTGSVIHPVIEQIIFADGTIWSGEELASYATTRPSEGNDSIRGTNRSEILDGLGGGDTVYGGAGSDHYIFKAGYGSLYIRETDDGQESSNELILGPGIVPDDVVVRYASYGNDLLLDFPGQDSIRVDGQFSNPDSGIDIIRFADGTVWTHDDLVARVVVDPSTNGADTIMGTVRDDVIDGLAGADALYGREGNDTLTGGRTVGTDLDWEWRFGRYGNLDFYSPRRDLLDGGAGDDTYLIQLDSGYDLIQDSSGNDRILLGEGLSFEDLIISGPLSYSSGHQGRTRVDFGTGAVFIDRYSVIERIESSDGQVLMLNQFDLYRESQLQGTSGDDRLEGTYRPEVITGYEGNDVLHGDGGRDTLRGDAGYDSLYGGTGNDILTDAYGENFLDGGLGDDQIAGRGYLSGGAGNDVLTGGGLLDGGAGNDRLEIDSGDARILFGRGSGNDLIAQAQQSDSLWIALTGDLSLEDIQFEWLPNEWDTRVLSLVLRDTGESLVGVSFAAGILFPDGSSLSREQIAQLAPAQQATQWNDALSGQDGADVLSGSAGSDSLDGGAGDDVLSGDEGNDTLRGGEGNDVLDGGAGDDYLYGGGGHDLFRFGRGSGRDTIVLRPPEGLASETAVIEFGEGILPEDLIIVRGYQTEIHLLGSADVLNLGDWLSGSASATRVSLRFANGQEWSPEEFLAAIQAAGNPGLGDFRDNDLVGTESADTIEGYAGDDRLQGGLGDDALNGGEGVDRLEGGAGNDTLQLGEAAAREDVVIFGYGDGQDLIYGHGAGDTIQLRSGITAAEIEFSLENSDLLIRLRGTEDAIRLSGWQGQEDRLEWLQFADGTRLNLADRHRTPAIGTEGDDDLSAFTSAFDDRIYGREGRDYLSGGQGDDWLYGGDGNDTLSGGDGADWMDGGAGNDTYVIDNNDTLVFGFESGVDSGSLWGGTIRLEDNVEVDDVYVSVQGFYAQIGLRNSDARLGSFNVITNADEGKLELRSQFAFGDGTVIEGDAIWQNFHSASASTEDDLLLGFGLGDVLLGGAGNDKILAGAGEDSLYGGAGHDSLFGGAGDDLLSGGTGNDFLQGGLGQDRYVFEAGFGIDTVRLSPDADAPEWLEFGAGINADMVSLSLQGGSLVLQIEPSGDRVIVENAWTTHYDNVQWHELNVAGVRFADGVVWLPHFIVSAVQLSTSGNDSMLGTEHGDHLAGAGGSDALEGSLGNDILEGGEGNDTLKGGRDSDWLAGGPGNDSLEGDAGDDVIVGGAGDDILSGGDGSDHYHFGRGSGVDVLADLAGDGVDTLHLGPGISVAEIERQLIDGNLVLRISGTDDTLTILGQAMPLAGVERIRFEDGTILDPRTWQERDSSFLVDSGAGLLTVPAGARRDSLRFGAGFSAEAVSVSRDGMDLVVSQGTDGVRFAGWFAGYASQAVLQALFEDGSLWTADDMSLRANTVSGSDTDDQLIAEQGLPYRLIGGGGHDRLTGSLGADSLEGGAGNDYLDGGAGGDRMAGGDGDDFYVVDGDSDVVVEAAGGGNDTVRMVAVADIIVSGEIENYEALGDASIRLIGNERDNRLLGTSGNNLIEGGTGNDRLDGRSGVDVLAGGSGDDVLVVDNAADTVIELSGEGDDTVEASISYSLLDVANIENIALLGEAYLSATGNSGANRLSGNAGNNILRGLGGNDTLHGGQGQDELYGGTGDDTYLIDDNLDQVLEYSGEGLDTVLSSVSHTLQDHVENLVLTGSADSAGQGNALDNRITGNSGGNSLSGGDGDDILDGREGRDTLIGGAGHDTYVFARGGGQDLIVEQDGAAGLDVVAFADGIGPDDLLLRRNGSDLVISVLDTTDRLTIRNYYTAAGRIESFRFVGGEEWSDAEVAVRVDGAPENHAPTVDRAVQDQLVQSGEEFVLALTDAFADIDAGDSLVYSVGLPGGAALPSWLRFDSDALTLAGTPTAGDVGTIVVQIVASDSGNRIVSDFFEIAVRNPNDRSPVVANPLADEAVNQGEWIEFFLPQDAFIDFDAGDRLTYTATLADGSALPNWLQFEPATGRFAGRAGAGDVGSLVVAVTARDLNGRSVSDQFVIAVADVNDAPKVTLIVRDQILFQGQAIALTLPEGLFVDREGDAYTLSVTLEDGSPLPSWISFDPESRQISGVADADSVGVTRLRITATDTAGAASSTGFSFVVSDVNDAPEVTRLVGNLVATEGNPLSIALPGGLFTDPDPDDSLTYSVEVLSRPDSAVTDVRLEMGPGGLTLQGQQWNGDRFQYGDYGDLDYWDVGEWEIRITATDRLGASASQDFSLEVVRGPVNHVPVIQEGEPWQTAGFLYSPERGMWRWLDVMEGIVVAETGSEFFVPVPQFTDVDNDVLAITVRPVDGDAADWMYDPGRQMMRYVGEGIPPRQVELEIVATDPSGASSFTTVGVFANRAPVVGDLPEIVVSEHQSFSVQLPASAFFDADGDELSFSAGQVYAVNPLTGTHVSWVNFDSETLTVSGVPGDYAVGTHWLDIVVTDPFSEGNGVPDATSGGWVNAPVGRVRITVLNVYDAPILVASLQDLSVQEDQEVNIAAASSFFHRDPGETLSYSATLANGAPLPDWLEIDPVTGQVTGTPQAEDVGAYSIRVTAHDRFGGSVSDVFDLNIALAPRNHAPSLVIPIGDEVYRQDQSFGFQVPVGAFRDVDGDELIYSVTLSDGQPLPDWIQFNPQTLSFSGHVPADQHAPIEIRLTATDPDGLQAFDTFLIGIDEAGQPPILVNPLEDQLVLEDQSLSFTIPEGAFADPDVGDVLVWQAVNADGGSLPAWLSFDPVTRMFSGTPENGDVGFVNVTVTALDSDGGRASDTFRITVQNTNDAPVVVAEEAATSEDSAAAVSGNVLSNDSDIDAGTSLQVAHAGVFQGSYGSLTLNADGSYSYVLANSSPLVQSLSAGQVVEERFIYRATDGLAQTTGELTIRITGANDAPVVVADVAVAQEDGAISVSGNVLTNDSDVDAGTFLQVANAGVYAGIYGELTLNADGSYGYILSHGSAAVQALASGQTLTEEFSYAAADGLAQTPGVLTITIEGTNDSPMVTADAAIAAEDAVIAASGNVLGNDLDIDASANLQVANAGVYEGSYGSLTLNADGDYSYLLANGSTAVQSLAAGQVVTETFGYRATDGVAETSGELTITINGANDAPVVVADAAEVPEDGAAASGNVLANDGDVDSGTVLQVANAGVYEGSYGSLTLNADGSYSYVLANASPAVQALAAGHVATEIFNYRATDGITEVDGALSITITGTNDVPVVVVDTAVAAEDSAVMVSGSVLDNDNDVDAGTSLQVANAGVYEGSYGTLTLDADGRYSYALANDSPAVQALAAGQMVVETFSYQVSDGITQTSSELTITITGTNDAPVVAADIAAVSEGGPLTVSGNVLSNDGDVDAGTVLQVANAGSYEGSYGSLTLSVDGSYSYSLANDGGAVQSLAAGQVVTEVFSYRVIDGAVERMGELTVTVTGSNDAPVTTADAVLVSEDVAMEAYGNVLANDSDIDAGATLQVMNAGVYAGIYGTLTLGADGHYSYALANDSTAVQSLGAGQVVTESFSYRATDGIAQADGQLTVNITGANDAPVVVADIAAVSEDAMVSASGNLLSNDGDVDTGTSLQVVNAGVYQGSYGSLTLNADGSYSYVLASGSHAVQSLAAGQVVTEVFSYSATDGLIEAESELTVTVTGSNDAPTLAVALADQAASSGEPVSWTIPVDSFTDLDQGDSLEFSALLSDGSTLPSWLSYDPVSRMFSGTPPAGLATVLDIRVTATDRSGLSASDVFRLTVEDNSCHGQTLVGTAFNDHLVGGECGDLLDGRAGCDRLEGKGGDDTFAYSVDGQWLVLLDQAINHDTYSLLFNPDDSVGLFGRNRTHDIFNGGDGYDVLNGTAQSDVIQLDDDSISALLGLLQVGPRLSSIERINAGSGNDVINLTSNRFAYGDVTLDGGEGDDALWAGGGNDVLLGGSGSDNLYGGAGNDLLDGGSGADILEGGAGNDRYVVDQVGDVIKEYSGGGVDEVSSGFSYGLGSHLENLTLTGTAAINGSGNSLNNHLVGNASSNTLDGGAGHDILDGGAGNDQLLGGSGNDRYRLGRGYGHDTISENDLTAGNQDVLQLAEDVASDQIWFRRNGNNLEISIIGTDDVMSIANWYSGSRYRVEQILAGDGQVLLDSQVDQLVNAMAAFAPPAAGQTSLSQSYQDALGGVIAANWQ